MTLQEFSKFQCSPYFNGTIIWISFVPLFSVWTVTFCLDLNEALSRSLGKSIIMPLL